MNPELPGQLSIDDELAEWDDGERESEAFWEAHNARLDEAFGD